MKNLLYSDDEIRELILDGLVSQFLVEHHTDLLRSLRRDAEETVSKFNSTQLRDVLAVKILHPNQTLSCILKSYKSK